MKKKESVLLIDDCEVDNFITSKILERCGVNNILIFSKATDALKYLGTSIVHPALMFVDLNMPLMSGFEFIDDYKKLEIAKYPTSIFILSASINPSDKEKAEKRQLGFIEKPLISEKLEEILKSTSIKKLIKCEQ